MACIARAQPRLFHRSAEGWEGWGTARRGLRGTAGVKQGGRLRASAVVSEPCGAESEVLPADNGSKWHTQK